MWPDWNPPPQTHGGGALVENLLALMPGRSHLGAIDQIRDRAMAFDA